MADDGNSDPFADADAGIEEADPFADAEAADPFADGDAGDIGDFGVADENDVFAGGLGEEEPMQAADPYDQMPDNKDEGGDVGEQKMDALPGPGMADEEDCSALNAWRKTWRFQLEEKESAAAKQKEQLRAAAREELNSMSEARGKAADARKEANRNDEMAFLEQREALAQPGKNPWERVVSLIDVTVGDSEKAKASERMRSILISMKGQKSGPGIPN